MADIIRARQGDTLDSLLWRERGLDASTLATVHDANPGLADLGPLLPIDTAVIVPAIASPNAPQTRALINLWD
jgi:phage tail protein X